MTTLRHAAVRPSIALLAALLLASSALIAVSAETQAAKPIPSVSYVAGSATCNPLFESRSVLEADFDLSANKGRWVHVQVKLVSVADPKGTVLVQAGTRMDTRQLLLMSKPVARLAGSAYEVTMTDKKANLLDGLVTVATSDPVDCS